MRIITKSRKRENRTSIEPKNERLMSDVVLSLEKPVKQSLLFIWPEFDVAGIMSELHRRLPRQVGHSVGLSPPRISVDLRRRREK